MAAQKIIRMLCFHLLCNIIVSRLYICKVNDDSFLEGWGGSAQHCQKQVSSPHIFIVDSKARQKTPEHPFHWDVCKLAARQSLRRGVMEAEGSGLTGAQTRRLLLWEKRCWVFKAASICALVCV